MPKCIRSCQHIFSCSVIRTQCRYNHWYFSLNESSPLKFLMTSQNVIPLLGFSSNKNSTIHTRWTICFSATKWLTFTVLDLIIPDILAQSSDYSWWRDQMETCSALLAICAGNSQVPGEFPAQRPVTQSLDVFFDLRLNKRLSKQWRGWWYERPSCPL